MEENNKDLSRLLFDGELLEIFDEKTLGEYTFREIAITTGGEYPNFHKISFNKKNSIGISELNIGDKIEIRANARGTRVEKDGKTDYYTNLSGYSFRVLEFKKDS